MSDSLSSFIASGIEFIVGGLMLLASTAFLLLAIGWEVPDFLSAVQWGAQDASWVVLGIALAAAYAAGIIGEGISRLLVEWDLTRLTQAHPPFVVGAAKHGTAVKEERERQRAVAMSVPQLSIDIDSQLKRLRIERTVLLCSLIVALGFLVAGDVVEFLVALCFAGLVGYLVHERFRRFCGAISRACALAEPAAPRPVTQNGSGHGVEVPVT